MKDDCEKCGWNLPQPSLADAVMGFRECSNCEHREDVPEQDRLEACYDIEQKIHVLEQGVFPLNK